MARQRAARIKPGTLIITPKDVAHVGTLVSSAPVKAIAIKLPPQPANDTVFPDQAFTQVVHRGLRLFRLRPHPEEAPARRFRQFPKIYFKT